MQASARSPRIRSVSSLVCVMPYLYANHLQSAVSLRCSVRETAVASACVIRVLITATFLLSVRWFVLRHNSLIFGQWRFAKGLAHPYLVVCRGKRDICFRKSP